MSNTIFRVGTANMYDNAIRNVSARQTSLVNLQENLTSGKRVVRASDDPVSAAQAERALTRISRIQTEQRALENQRNAIAQAESTMGDAIGLVQEARQLMVSAGNGTLTSNDRATIANQLQSLRDQLIAVANRTDTNGIPLLGALGSPQSPFKGPLNGTPDYEFAGQAGQTASDGVTLPNTLDGHSAFMFYANGDTIKISPQASVFSVIDKAIAEIKAAPNSNVAAQAIGQALANVDIGLERMSNIRSYAGELLNRADRITGDQEKRSVQLESDRSRAEDLDMIKGISDFQNQQTGYQAALQAYASVQKLSLFNYIG